LRARRLVAERQRERDVAQVDQIEPDDERAGDRVGEPFVARKAVDEKDAAVLAERASHPDGQRHADAEIQRISRVDDHESVLLLITVISVYPETCGQKNAFSAPWRFSAPARRPCRRASSASSALRAAAAAFGQTTS